MQALLIPPDDRKAITVIELADDQQASREQLRALIGADIHSGPFHGRQDVMPLFDPDSTGPVNTRATFLVACDPILGPCVLVGVDQVTGQGPCPLDLIERLRGWTQ